VARGGAVGRFEGGEGRRGGCREGREGRQRVLSYVALYYGRSSVLYYGRSSGSRGAHTQHTQHTHTVHTEAHTSPTRFSAGKISLSLIHTHTHTHTHARARAHARTHARTHAPRSPGRSSGSRSGRAGCPCRPATRRTCRGRIGLGRTERRVRTSIDIDRHRSMPRTDRIPPC
jgi:hypothetical protein